MYHPATSGMVSVEGGLDPTISPVKHPSDNIDGANSNGNTIQHESKSDTVNSSRQHSPLASTVLTNSSFSPRTPASTRPEGETKSSTSLERESTN